MSLLTPPTSCQRDKENNNPSGGPRVAWSNDNEYHGPVGGSTPRAEPLSSKVKPTPKSILKKSLYIDLPLLDIDINKRATTPEPLDPASDRDYLQYPVSQIIAPDASLRELIEAYSVLTARIKSALAESADIKTSCPLFLPLRKNVKSVKDAIVRDLAKALEDPASFHPSAATETEHESEQEAIVLLPSPKSSPKKKKGMTADQVKYARDLCTTCHAALKFLSLAFTMPVIYCIFKIDQLGEILTQVLAIPLAPELPSVNARKTYALAICVIQVQRLPGSVLLPAGDRITYALRRGIEGELGKEGKKGSAGDGSKAVHELSIYQPSTFVPAFVELLPSILANLIAPNLALRTQACHALGGFALGCINMSPQSTVHTQISDITMAFFLTSAAESAKGSRNANIFTTLRTTINSPDPQHVAQGPVWALCVLSSLIVLMGSGLKTNAMAARIVHIFLNTGRRHEKSSVRALACIVWRCFTWTYFQPLLPRIEKEEEVVQPEDNGLPKQVDYWSVVSQELEIGAGTATIAMLLNNEERGEPELKKAFRILEKMAEQAGSTCDTASDILGQLVGKRNPKSCWNVNRLLPPALFSTMPGLLTTEFKSLSSVVKPIITNQSPQICDIQRLTPEEVNTEWIWNALLKIFRDVLSNLILTTEGLVSAVSFWGGLWKRKFATVSVDDDQGIKNIADEAIDIIIDVIEDKSIELVEKTDASASTTEQDPTCEAAAKVASVMWRKIDLAEGLWKVLLEVIPDQRRYASDKLMESYISLEPDLGKDYDSARKSWADTLVEMLLCDIEGLEDFWERKVQSREEGTGLQQKSLALLWKTCIEEWKEHKDATWEGSIFLLGVPFADRTCWEVSNEDCDIWDDLLRYSISKGFDTGIEAVNVLERVAEIVSQNQCPASVSCTRAADMLLTHLDMSDVRELSCELFSFVNDVLVSTYPPEPRNKITSMWMIRSLTRVIDACPTELRVDLLKTVQDGLRVWIHDGHEAINEEEYMFNILPLYQTTLVSVQCLPPTATDTLERLAPVIGAPFQGRRSVAKVASTAFREFWEATFANERPPAGGWPEEIQMCLRAGGSEIVVASEGDKNVERVEDHTRREKKEISIRTGKSEQRTPERVRSPGGPPTAQPGEVKESKPIFPFIGIGAAFVRAIIPSQDKAEGATNCPPTAFWPQSPGLPSTPSPSTKTRLPISTPPRPKRTSAYAQTSHLMNRDPPTSPTSSPRRASMAPKSIPCSPVTPPGGRSNKENVPPFSMFLSVAEQSSPGSSPRSTSSVLGKRDEKDEDEDERIAKKGRTDTSYSHSSDDSDEESVIANTLIQPVERISVAEVFAAPRRDLKPIPISRARKGIFMIAVEVPFLQQVNKRRRHNGRTTVSFEAISTEEGTSTGTSLKRHNSETNDLLTTPVRVAKRIRADSHGSNLLLSPEQVVSEGSSDDDPYLGQVTPHGIISPIIRPSNCDPPSDDSVETASPSRDAIARRVQRSGSLSRLLPKVSSS